MENEIELQFKCSYCGQIGGKHLGFDKNGDEVCNKCGEFIKRYRRYIHFEKWQISNDTPNNRTLKQNDNNEE